MSSAAKSSSLSRSVYVAQLRRAFLLRAHPDRFRNFDEDVRRGQATLLQALGDRFNSRDFQEYTSNFSPRGDSFGSMTKPKQSVPYVLEKQDGSLLQRTIQLNDSVENVLKHLVDALQLSGAASLPPPPPAPEGGSGRANAHGRSMHGRDPHDMAWAPDPSSYGSTSNINHQFDINTNRGRDLKAFLDNLLPEEVEMQRAARMEAMALATVARRLYSFQAIDGISAMEWSSDSFAFLLRSFIRLHEEYSATHFTVQSFYPLRLVFCHDSMHSQVDTFGGVLYLHPAATQVQVLETLRDVTEERLQEFEVNRERATKNTSILQNDLGVRLTKGYSCSSYEYHSFLERCANQVLESTLTVKQEEEDGSSVQRVETGLALERIRVTVEAPETIRRAKLTREGHIRVDAGMNIPDLRLAILRFSEAARRRMEDERQAQQKCSEVIQEVQWALGLQRFLSSLTRIMEHQAELRDLLAGHSLEIAGEGQFCHIGDDGSVVVPHNWT
eukprot:Nitzschia sp. Nitz4//scaffold44_size153857//69347//70879//NITZ4_002722-RA/size153857-processed-gene-0.102-mRNA-1//-1//CDS//3329552160//9270//frame0